jgi:hypothetical protein
VSDLLTGLPGKLTQNVVIAAKWLPAAVRFIFLHEIDESPHTGTPKFLNPLAMFRLIGRPGVRSGQKLAFDHPVASDCWWSGHWNRKCWFWRLLHFGEGIAAKESDHRLFDHLSLRKTVESGLWDATLAPVGSSKLSTNSPSGICVIPQIHRISTAVRKSSAS